MVARLIAWLKAEWQSIRVIATFLTLIVAFFFLLSWDPIVRYVDLGGGLARLAAWMSYGILRVAGKVVGFDVRLSGVRLSTSVLGAEDFEVDVTAACSGAVPTSIYLAAVFAFPAKASAKLLGALMGVSVIHLINLVRVSALFIIGLYFHQFFHDTHVYVAQALVVAAAVALWLYWVGRFAQAPSRQPR